MKPGAVVGTPALYPVTITHTRTERVRRSFRYGGFVWFVDIDALPRLPAPLRPFARFRVRDHLDGSGGSIRENVDRWLTEHGADRPGGPVYMLASAAVMGYVFNPLSTFWCHDAAGRLMYVIAEVHNTYGRRHAYLLRPDADGRAEVRKEFYVSPFLQVDGRYTMSVPTPGDRVRLAVRLARGEPGEERTVFAASMVGRRRPAQATELVRLLVRYPWPTLRVAALIRWQGIRLWLRGLPVVPRQPAGSKEGVR